MLGALARQCGQSGDLPAGLAPRPISPWSRPDPVGPAATFWDRLPIFGWLGLRREAGLHGAGFWVRPMLLELLAGIGLAWLYWWEVGRRRLLPPGIPPAFAPEWLSAAAPGVRLAHTVLITLMLVASLIDADEKIIPDEITIPGTLVGLLLAAAWPWSLLPDVIPLGGGCLGVEHSASGFAQRVAGRGWTAIRTTASLVLGWLVGGCGVWRSCRARGTDGMAGAGRSGFAGPESPAPRHLPRSAMALMGSLAMPWFGSAAGLAGRDS